VREERVEVSESFSESNHIGHIEAPEAARHEKPVAVLATPCEERPLLRVNIGRRGNVRPSPALAYKSKAEIGVYGSQQPGHGEDGGESVCRLDEVRRGGARVASHPPVNMSLGISSTERLSLCGQAVPLGCEVQDIHYSSVFRLSSGNASYIFSITPCIVSDAL
jgi:hypothetical protein